MLHVQPRLLDLPQFGQAVNATSIRNNPINMTEEGGAGGLLITQLLFPSLTVPIKKKLKIRSKHTVQMENIYNKKLHFVTLL